MNEKKEQEYKNLIEAQKQYTLDSIASLKDEIGRSLSAEYSDFRESLDMPMNDMLGEIYKHKLLQIEKILNRHGITIK